MKRLIAFVMIATMGGCAPVKQLKKDLATCAAENTELKHEIALKNERLMKFNQAKTSGELLPLKTERKGITLHDDPVTGKESWQK